MLGQGLFAFQQALLGLGLFAAVRHARRHHLGDALVDLAQLRDQLLALGARAHPAIEGVLDQFEEVQGDLAGDIHHLEPGEVGEHRQAEEEQGEEHQRAALHVQRIHRDAAQALADGAAGRGAGRHVAAGVEMDVGQCRAGQDQEDQPDQAPGKQPGVPFPRQVAAAEYLPSLDAQQQRKEVGEVAERHEQDIGGYRTEPTGGILHLVNLARVTPARIGRVIGEQSHPQVEAERAQRDQDPFLQAGMQLLTPCGGMARGGRILQIAIFPAHGWCFRSCLGQNAPIVRL